MIALWMTALSLACSGETARILVFQPTPARGHIVVTEPLYEELAARGHQLTLVTSYPHTTPVDNLHEVDVSVDTQAKKWLGNVSVEEIRTHQPDQFRSLKFMIDTDYSICEAVYSNDDVKNLLASEGRYDMVITEVFVNDCFVPFAAKFKAPLVSVVTSYPPPWVADRVGLPDNPSYIPNYFMDLGSDMCFSERLYNTMFLVYAKIMYYFVSVPKTQRLVDKHFGDSVPPVGEIVRNTSLILVNSHFSLAASRPFTHNVVEVGGIHIKNTSSPVPKDLLDILDRSHQGVLVVSFGSMVRIASLGERVIRTFLASFSKIPQTVVFKYEEQLEDVPKNVVVRKWLPQREIVGHNNVKAVLIHGGLASTTEAVYFGKPLVGVPFFSDQFLNIKTICRLGAGVLLDLESLTVETLDSALDQVLNNPIFAERARQLSVQFRDRPRPPLDTAVYWVEYVLRHRGAPQLRSSSVDLAWGQGALLDIVAVLFGVVFLVYYLLYSLCRFWYRGKQKKVLKVS